MKRFKRVMALALACVMVLSLAGCGGAKSKIKGTISDFEKACQELDLEAMLDCVDPTVAEPAKAGLSLLGALAGDEAEMLGEVASAIFGSVADPDEFLSKIRIKAGDISVDGDSATVEATLSAEVGGEKIEQPATIRMKQDDDEWYIAGVSLQ